MSFQRTYFRLACLGVFSAIALALSSACSTETAGGSDSGTPTGVDGGTAKPDAEEAITPPPPGCEAIDVGTLRNGTQLTPPNYGKQPTLRGLLATDLGDTTIQDAIEVRLRYPTGVGSFSFAGENADLFTCQQCVLVHQDLDPKKNTAVRAFVATEGSLSITEAKSGDQVTGTLRNVKLLEARITNDGPADKSTPAPGGKCLWIGKATFSTVQPEGCNPLAADSCPDGVCYPQNAAGSDGLCVKSIGTKALGAKCSVEANGDSDCAPGLACHEGCRKTCDFRSANPGCPGTQQCWLGGFCADSAEVFSVPRDSAKVGEECKVAGSELCGVRGALGTCTDIDGSGPSPRKCYPFARSPSECAPGELLGFYTFEHDLSLGFCYPPAP